MELELKLLIKNCKFLIFIFIILFSYDVFAQSINTDSYSQKDIFNNASRYDFTTSNTLGNDMSLLSVGTIGTRYNGKSYYFQFNFHKSLTANKIYELKVSSTTSDFTSNINKDDITPLCYSSFAYNFNTKECGDISVISVIRGSGNQSKDFTIRFSPLQAITYWGFKFGGGFNALTGVSNFLINNFDLTEVNADNTDDIINNNNQNTQNIIDNQNQNTQEIIDNLNNCRPSRNLLPVDEQFSVTTSRSISISLPAGTYTMSGKITGDSNYYSLVIFNKNGNELTSIGLNHSGGSTQSTFTLSTNIDEILLYSNSNWSTSNGHTSTFNQLQLEEGSSKTSYEKYGQICTSKLDDVNTGINNVNDSINNSNVENGVGSDFFNNFSSQDFGLSSIITLPLTTIQSLANTSCVSLNIPIPFTNSTIPLPCMTQVYQTYIPTIFSIWQIVSFGIIAYFICIDIVHLVKGFKDPDSDKVEVLDL